MVFYFLDCNNQIASITILKPYFQIYIHVIGFWLLRGFDYLNQLPNHYLIWCKYLFYIELFLLVVNTLKENGFTFIVDKL